MIFLAPGLSAYEPEIPLGRRRLYDVFVTISLDAGTEALFRDAVIRSGLLPGEEDLSTLVRAALAEWLSVRAATSESLPALLAKLSAHAVPDASQRQATRDTIVRVGLTTEESESLRDAACAIGWGRLTPNMVLVGALAEWTDLRIAKAGPLSVLLKELSRS